MAHFRLLLTTTTPGTRIEGWAASDQMAYRLTRGQGPFTLYQHTHASGLHLLAQNLSCPSTLLENPSLDDLAAELSRGYDYVGISFDPLNTERMREICALIRTRSPKSKILLGGHGVICLTSNGDRADQVESVDGICRGEGVAYLRDLFGEPPGHGVNSLIPKEGASLPWLNPRPIGTNGVILSGLGCTQRCSFCATSAMTKGRYVEVMNAGQIFEAMRTYWASSPFTASVSIYDENFLDHRSKVMELGERIRGDGSFGLSRMNFSAFGSISALAKYDVEELLLAGLDKVWCGVESKFTSLAKRRGLDVAETFARLHAAGIKTIGSWIIGQDFQTPANIQEDMDFFLNLDPTFQQLSVLGVVPGTPLWRSMLRQGRIPSEVGWKDYHLYGRTFVHDHFSHQQMRAHLDDLYDRIYRTKGSALMKSLEVNLNGYQTCLGSRHRALREDKAAYFAAQCRSYHPLLKTALAFAPSGQVKARLEEVDRRYQDLFGRPHRHEVQLADQILSHARQAYPEESLRGRPHEEPFRRYTYPALQDRPAGRPYRVEYPDSRPTDWLAGAPASVAAEPGVRQHP